jgi:D-Tyr-tRNAtyr deacylase
MYDKFVDLFKKEHQFVKEGKFGASMNISSINKGPVTFNFKT